MVLLKIENRPKLVLRFSQTRANNCPYMWYMNICIPNHGMEHIVTVVIVTMVRCISKDLVGNNNQNPNVLNWVIYVHSGIGYLKDWDDTRNMRTNLDRCRPLPKHNNEVYIPCCKYMINNSPLSKNKVIQQMHNFSLIRAQMQRQKKRVIQQLHNFSLIRAQMQRPKKESYNNCIIFHS